MAGTRSSSRLSASQNSSPPSAKNEAGTKRKASTDASPSSKNDSKRGKTQDGQQTLEQTGIKTQDENQEQHQDQDTKQDDNMDAKAKNESDIKKAEENGQKTKPGDSFQGENKEGESKSDSEKALKDSRGGQGLNTIDAEMPDEKDVPHDDIHAHMHENKGQTSNDLNRKDQQNKDTVNKDQEKQQEGEKGEETTGGAVEEDKERADAEPSNVLEKGIIYFFTRGRVGVDNMESVTDVQRSYFVLRPLPAGAKLTDGKIEDLKNARLLALPKKVWPKSSADKFMAFVEKAGASVEELKNDFMQGSEYSTATVGTRQTPPVTPVGEGVYAITSTGQRGESHIAYMLTIPQEPGQLQKDMGIRPQGSFLISLKNPTVKGPANAALPESPDWPKEYIEEFHSRSWMPAEPKHLDYANAQILLIGESIEDSHALDATEGDKKDDAKETPKEEMEKLEHEDEIRVRHLQGDDTVFADLDISKKELNAVATTW